MSPEKRQEMGEVIRKAIRETGYTSLGTLEFLMDEQKNLFFLEMNTRVQVEHPVTEMVTGLDVVKLQIGAAAGEKIELPDTRPWSFRGHAIECRINAEDPVTFAPWPGLITEYSPLAAPASASTAASTAAGESPPTTTPSWPKSSFTPHPRRSDRSHAPRPRRVHRRRHPHEHRPPQALLLDDEVIRGEMTRARSSACWPPSRAASSAVSRSSPRGQSAHAVNHQLTARTNQLTP